jgi:hypothetical protein
MPVWELIAVTVQQGACACALAANAAQHKSNNAIRFMNPPIENEAVPRRGHPPLKALEAVTIRDFSQQFGVPA